MDSKTNKVEQIAELLNALTVGELCAAGSDALEALAVSAPVWARGAEMVIERRVAARQEART